MELHPNQFPQHRRADPRRRAEARVFDSIRASGRLGFGYYEWRRNPTSPELDFAVWIQNRGRFGLEVKGGHYFLENGGWFLITANGRERADSPFSKVWDATMSLRQNVVVILGKGQFFIAVVVFPDMEPDGAIADMARRSKANVVWGVDNIIDRLVDIAADVRVHHPPGLEDIRREVDAVTDHQVAYLGEGRDGNHRIGPPLPPAQPARPAQVEAPVGARLEIAGGGITIQHVGTLIVHAAPRPAPDAGVHLELPD